MHALNPVGLLQRLPDTIRGAILGLASRAPRNDVAIYITFGSTSRGIPLALTRIFQRVGDSVYNLQPAECVVKANVYNSYASRLGSIGECSIVHGTSTCIPNLFLKIQLSNRKYSLLQVGIVNFNPFYQAPDPENPVSSKSYGEPDIIYVQCQEDILTSELSVSNEVVCVCACACACMCVCVRVHACVHVLCACVCVCVCVSVQCMIVHFHLIVINSAVCSRTVGILGSRPRRA